MYIDNFYQHSKAKAVSSFSLIYLNDSRNKMGFSKTEQEQTRSANKEAVCTVLCSLLLPLTD